MVHQTKYSEGNRYLDMMLNQRSSDYAVSCFINELQYVALQMMVAKHLGIVPGKFTHVMENVQIYDRHIDNAKVLISREPIECTPALTLNVPDGTNFYDILFEAFSIERLPVEQIKNTNPQLTFDLGI